MYHFRTSHLAILQIIEATVEFRRTYLQLQLLIIFLYIYEVSISVKYKSKVNEKLEKDYQFLRKHSFPFKDRFRI